MKHLINHIAAEINYTTVTMGDSVKSAKRILKLVRRFDREHGWIRNKDIDTRRAAGWGR